jgi:hypothetical protein
MGYIEHTIRRAQDSISYATSSQEAVRAAVEKAATERLIMEQCLLHFMSNAEPLVEIFPSTGEEVSND